MGRPSQFNEEEVLGAAMEVFWRSGYTGTSMSELREATGLNTGSIYNRFGSKKGLFLQSLDHYIAQVIDTRISDVLNQGDPLDGIESFFSTAFESLPVRDLIGCLLTNTSMDREIDDAEISLATRRGIERIETAIKRRLAQAREAGDIDADTDLRATAIHLLSCFQGLCVLGRVTRDKKRLRIVTEQAMRAVR